MFDLKKERYYFDAQYLNEQCVKYDFKAADIPLCAVLYMQHTYNYRFFSYYEIIAKLL